MAISYSFKVEGDILFVKASGFESGIQDVSDYGSAVYKEAVSCGIKKILCNEIDLKYKLGLKDTYKLINSTAENMNKDFKLAIVTNEINYLEATFFELILLERGYSVNFFKSIEKARDWLNHLNKNPSWLTFHLFDFTTLY